MADSRTEISKHLADVYSVCHEKFQRLMADAREPGTDDEAFASACRELCDCLIEFQQTWSRAHGDADESR